MDPLVSAVRAELESRGVLGNLRAALRLSVFTCVDDRERKNGVANERVNFRALQSDDARLVLSLIAQALGSWSLKSTRACLLAESGMVRRYSHK